MQARKSLLNWKTNLYEDWFLEFYRRAERNHTSVKDYIFCSTISGFFRETFNLQDEKLIETSALISTGKI